MEKKRLKLVEANSNPEILSRYLMRSSEKQDGLIRPPYVARFTPSGLYGGSYFEIRLINTHIIFGKPAKLDISLGVAALRRHEFKILSERIYPRVSTKRYGDNMPAYTVLLGDYNLCLSGSGPKLDAVVPIGDTMLKTVQAEKTTLKRPATSSQGEVEGEELEEEIMEEGSQDYYSQDYDHFSYDIALLDKMKLEDSRVEALGKYYGNDLEGFRREISDHVPIKLTLNLKLR